MTFKDGNPDFQRVSYSYTYSNLGSYTTKDITKTNLGWTSNPSGYTPFCCSSFTTGHGSV